MAEPRYRHCSLDECPESEVNGFLTDIVCPIDGLTRDKGSECYYNQLIIPKPAESQNQAKYPCEPRSSQNRTIEEAQACSHLYQQTKCCFGGKCSVLEKHAQTPAKCTKEFDVIIPNSNRGIDDVPLVSYKYVPRA